MRVQRVRIRKRSRAFFEKLGKLHAEFVKLSEKHGPGHDKAQDQLDAMADMFMHLKLPAKMVDHLVDRLRYAVSRSREHERAILQMVVRQAKMPKLAFIKSFHKTKQIRVDRFGLTGKQKWVAPLSEYTDDIRKCRPGLPAGKQPIALRSPSSKISTAPCRLVRPRHDVPRKKWSKPTSGW